MPLPAAGAVVLMLVTGCGAGTVTVDPYPLTTAGRTGCAGLVKALPRKVSDQARRRTTGSADAAAWGDPPIVLRCGVGRPAGFTRTATCLTRNGIDWFVPRSQLVGGGADVTLTLVKRSPRVQVSVPGSYLPGSGPATVLTDVMSDLDHVVRAHTRVTGHCQ